MIHKNAARNREIFALHQHGKPLADLASQYGLALATLRQVICAEKHLQAVSMEPVYREARAMQMEVKL
jgi:hypothetical protein